MPIYMNPSLASSLNFTKNDKMSLNFTKPGEKQGFNPQPEPPGDKKKTDLSQPGQTSQPKN